MGHRRRVLYLLTLILTCVNGDETDDEYTDLCMVHMDAKHAEYVTEYLVKVGFEHQHQVADYYIFKDVVSQNFTNVDSIRSKIKMKIRSMKRVRKEYLTYNSDSYDSPEISNSWTPYATPPVEYAPGVSIIMCAPYYDALQGIDGAWKLGYTGKGVVVAVTDCGFTVEHPELSPNINLELSKNFVQDDTPDLSPGVDREHMLPLVNHGNECASVVAGVYNNNLCGAGVAYNATLAVIKIGQWIEGRHGYNFETDETKYGVGLIHECSEIDIYSNSWGASRGLIRSCSFIKAILNEGIEKGRDTKGAIYVFASGRVGDCLTSSIYTISVGGLNYDRSLPDNSEKSSATLVSAFSGQNSSFTDKKMTLKGPARTHLRHISSYGRSCGHHCAGVTGKVSTNRPVHDMLGFGIVNATNAVLLAATWNATSQQVNVAVEFIWQNANLTANVTCADGCVKRVEHVKVTFRIASNKYVRLTLLSPGGTVSILANGLKEIRVEDNCQEVETLSVNFWDESSTGEWTIIPETCEKGNKERCVESRDVVRDIKLVIYGTGTQGNNTEDNAATTYSSTVDCYTTTPTDYSTTPVNDHSSQRTSMTVIAIVVPVSIFIAVFILIIAIYRYRRKNNTPKTTAVYKPVNAQDDETSEL